MRKILISGIGVLLLLNSCQKSKDVHVMQMGEPSLKEEMTASAGSISDSTLLSTGSEKKIIQQCQLKLQVDSLPKIRTTLSSLMQKHRAYIMNENENRTSGNYSTSLVIRVPNNHLESFVDELCGVAKYVDNKELSSDDIGLEYVDLQARLRAKQEVEKRYLQLLQKAGKINELIEVEQQLGEVRSDIEAMQGRLHYFDNKVAYATVSVQLYQILPFSESPGPGFINKASKAFARSLKLLQEGTLLVISLWPLLIIPGMIFLYISKKKSRILFNKNPV